MWSYSQRFEQAQVAFDLGKWQSEFDAAEETDKAYAIEVWRERMIMKAWENEIAAREMKAQSGKHG